jgi:hypothetical protein
MRAIIIGTTLVIIITGCSTPNAANLLREAADRISADQQQKQPAAESLPVNPPIPDNPAGTSAQLYYFNFKSYDNTFRIRWPSYFATDLGVGPGSYVMVNDQRAEFRSFDKDSGAQRPSYTMPGPESRLSAPYRCILHAADGRVIAWFETPVYKQGRLQ